MEHIMPDIIIMELEFEKDEHKAFIYYRKSADRRSDGTYNAGYCVIIMELDLKG